MVSECHEYSGNEWSASKLRLQMVSTEIRGLVQECCLLSSNKKLDWILVFRYFVRVRGPPRSNQEAPLRRWIISFYVLYRCTCRASSKDPPTRMNYLAAGGQKKTATGFEIPMVRVVQVSDG